MAAAKVEGRDADFIALDLTSKTEPTFESHECIKFFSQLLIATLTPSNNTFYVQRYFH
jgi:hypothetical protein